MLPEACAEKGNPRLLGKDVLYIWRDQETKRAKVHNWFTMGSLKG